MAAGTIFLSVLRRNPRRLLLPSVARQSSRALTSGYSRMSPRLSHFESSTSTSDEFQVLPTAEKSGDSEDVFFEQQVRNVESWWKSPRFEGIKRSYTAEDVVRKRGSLQQVYTSSIMARKLFNLLNERAAEGKPVHTSKQ